MRILYDGYKSIYSSFDALQHTQQMQEKEKIMQNTNTVKTSTEYISSIHANRFTIIKKPRKE